MATTVVKSPSFLSPVSPSPASTGDRSQAQRQIIIAATVVVAITAYWLSRGPLNEMAARTLSVFLIAAVFWATEALPLFSTAFVVIGLEILFLASDGGLAEHLDRFLIWLGLTVNRLPEVPPMSARMFLGAFAKDIVILFMGGFLLSTAITKHGIDRAIAGKILRPFTRSPLLLLYGVLGLTAFFSMWMSNTATAAMMIAITNPMVRLLPREERFHTAIVLAVPFGANIGGIGTPIGTPPNAIVYGALDASGYKVTFLKWMLVAVPLEILLLAGLGLLLYVCFKPDQHIQFGDLDVGGTISTRGKITLIILGLTVLLWLTSSQHGLQAGVTGLLAAAALTALGVLDRHDVDAIDWDILILMWGGLSLGIAMQQSGLTGYLGRAGLSMLPGGALTVAMAVTCIGVGLSTFMSNTATAALVVPMALALSLPDREQFAILAALACSFAMAMPVSTPPNAIAYATGQISIQAMIRTGGLISIISIIVMLLGYKIMLPLIF